jgi:hypothetical protein
MDGSVWLLRTSGNCIFRAQIDHRICTHSRCTQHYAYPGDTHSPQCKAYTLICTTQSSFT